MGDACAACYEAASWFFPWMTWDAFVSQYRSDTSFKATADSALRHRASESLPQKPQVVEGKVSVELEVQREFAVASEGDLRRATGLTRVPAKALKYLPVLSVPCEQGTGMESLYVFAEEAEEEVKFRKAIVKVKMGTELQRIHLPEGFYLSKEHTQDMVDHCKDTSHDANGLKHLLDRTSFIPTFDMWKAKKLAEGKEKEEGESFAEAVQNSTTVLEGPAAQSNSNMEHCTPPASLKRSASGTIGTPPAEQGQERERSEQQTPTNLFARFAGAATAATASTAAMPEALQPSASSGASRHGLDEALSTVTDEGSG
eukprot:6492721-Amphidinium_carterae.1